MNIDNDLLTRSLARLANDPPTEAEARTRSARFAEALRHLATDPRETARVDAIVNDASHDVSSVMTAREPERSFVEVGSGRTTKDEPARFATGKDKSPLERLTAAATAFFASVAGPAICATLVAIYSHSLFTTMFVVSGLMVIAIVPVVVHSYVLLMSSKALVREDRASLVLQMMMVLIKGDSALLPNRKCKWR